jgi:hypothetical protein
MNNQIKILLTINGIPGATLHKTKKTKIPVVIRKKETSYKYYGDNYKGKDGDKIVYKGFRKMWDIEAVPCSKSIKLTYDAYNYMTSTETPEWYHKKDWKRLKPEVRLEMHLQRMCEANNGESFSYSILED